MDGLRSIGLSYGNAPIAVREQVVLEGDEVSSYSIAVKDTLSVSDLLVVSTCNRTEIYYTSAEEIADELIQLLAVSKGFPVDQLQSYFVRRDTADTINHLFRVGLGLESKVLGDIQVSNQIKRAYQTSADLQLAGPFLHRLMHSVFYANKRVVQETQLQDGNASVASVSVEVIKTFIEKLESPHIAIVGLGEIGQNVLDNLRDMHVPVTLINRTKEKADKLSVEPQIVSKSFDDLSAVIASSDVIISAVSNQPTIIKRADIPSDSLKLLIDLSVPRSIEASVEELPSVVLYNIDTLAERTEKAKKRRQNAIPQVEQIIDEAIAAFNKWQEETEVSPTIQRLKQALDQIRREELSRYDKISEEERELLDIVTKNMIQKVIKLPVLQLKAACKRGEADTLAGVLSDLFNLEKEQSLHE